MDEIITVVDTEDNVSGPGEKMEVHRNNILHRAFSVFVFTKNGDLILQQRAHSKYHCGGEWSNTCCGHPRYGEELESATHRRLFEEMGFDCQLTELFTFHYQTTFANGLSENEIDHVFVGVYDGAINSNLDEVAHTATLSLSVLSNRMKEGEDEYTYWFEYIIKDKTYFNLLQEYVGVNSCPR